MQKPDGLLKPVIVCTSWQGGLQSVSNKGQQHGASGDLILEHFKLTFHLFVYITVEDGKALKLKQHLDYCILKS